MLDIKFVRANPDAVKENIKKKFQDEKLPMVDEVIELDAKYRAAKTRCDELRAQRNKTVQGDRRSDGQGSEGRGREGQGRGQGDGRRADQSSKKDEKVFAEEVKNRMMVIPNIIDPSVPIGKDDSENVENERFGEPVVPDFEVPYHVDIMESLRRHRSRRCSPHLRQRLLLPQGRHRPPALLHPVLRARLHDRPRLHLLHSAVHDPR